MVKAVSAAINLKSVPHTYPATVAQNHSFYSICVENHLVGFSELYLLPVGQCLIFWLLCYSIIWITLPAAETGNQSYIALRNISKFCLWLGTQWYINSAVASYKLQLTGQKAYPLTICLRDFILSYIFSSSLAVWDVKLNFLFFFLNSATVASDCHLLMRR